MDAEHPNSNPPLIRVVVGYEVGLGINEMLYLGAPTSVQTCSRSRADIGAKAFKVWVLGHEWS